MFTIRCYKNEEVVCEFNEKDRQGALLYAEIMFNSGYTKVEIYDADLVLIETF